MASNPFAKKRERMRHGEFSGLFAPSSREKAEFRVAIGIAEVAEADAYQEEFLHRTQLDPTTKRKGYVSKFLA